MTGPAPDGFDPRLGRLLQNPEVEALKLFGPQQGVVVGALGRMMSTEGPTARLDTASARKAGAYQQTIRAVRSDLDVVQALGPGLVASCAGPTTEATIANTMAVAAGRVAYLPGPDDLLVGIMAGLATWSAAVGMLPPASNRIDQ